MLKYICLTGIMFVILFVTCRRDDDPKKTQKLEIDVQTLDIQTDAFSATVESRVTCNMKVYYVYVVWATREDFKDAQLDPMTKGNDDIYKIKLTLVRPNTKYYFRYYIITDNEPDYRVETEAVDTFTTSKAYFTTVRTSKIDSLTRFSVNAEGIILYKDSLPILKRGIVYGLKADPTVYYDSIVNTLSLRDTFVCPLKNLAKNTTYHYRAYVMSENGYHYGEDSIFITKSTEKPVVQTLWKDSVKRFSAIVGGLMIDDGDDPITEKGIVYNTAGSPTITDKKAVSKSEKDSFFCRLTDLQKNTTYHYRAYATNKTGTSYGADSVFTTTSSEEPTVKTSFADSITRYTARIEGILVDDGENEITERGFAYHIDGQPEKKIIVPQTDSLFHYTLQGLEKGVSYYYRAYVKSEIGTSYGEEMFFTTKTIDKPTIRTTETVNITAYTARPSGEIIDNGGTEITEYGIVYSTNPNPTILDPKMSKNGNLSGQFYFDLSNLTHGTTYHYRAYARNSEGLSYGEDSIFTTVLLLPPTVITGSAINVTQFTATLSGEVKETGGKPITESGIVYSTSAEPTVENGNKLTYILQLGEMKVNVSGLSQCSTYHYRAYATNEIGTGYGDDKTFTMKCYKVPTVETYAATNISINDAIFNGRLFSNGNQTVTQFGFVYSSTVITPTLDNYGKGDIVSFTNLTYIDNNGVFDDHTAHNLTLNTTYYVRAFAVNSQGIGYGAVNVFKTFDTPYPIFEYVTMRDVNCNSFSLEAKMKTGDQVKTNSEVGVIYSTDKSKLDNISPTALPTGVGINRTTMTETMLKNQNYMVTFDMQNLSPQTTYYYRAFAKNTKGYGYSSDVNSAVVTETKRIPSIRTDIKNIDCYTRFVGEVDEGCGYEVTDWAFVYMSYSGETSVSSKTYSHSSNQLEKSFDVQAPTTVKILVSYSISTTTLLGDFVKYIDDSGNEVRNSTTRNKNVRMPHILSLSDIKVRKTVYGLDCVTIDRGGNQISDWWIDEIQYIGNVGIEYELYTDVDYDCGSLDDYYIEIDGKDYGTYCKYLYWGDVDFVGEKFYNYSEVYNNSDKCREKINSLEAPNFKIKQR